MLLIVGKEIPDGISQPALLSLNLFQQRSILKIIFQYAHQSLHGTNQLSHLRPPIFQRCNRNLLLALLLNLKPHFIEQFLKTSRPNSLQDNLCVVLNHKLLTQLKTTRLINKLLNLAIHTLNQLVLNTQNDDAFKMLGIILTSELAYGI